MKQNDTVTPRQMIAAAFVAVFSPLIRRFPRVLVETAGRTAWLSVPMAVLPLAFAVGVLWLFYRRQPPGTGFADILSKSLGKVPGRLLTGLYGLWFTVYAGFLLRSGADRFISTVYPGAGPATFVIIMALLCLTAAMGRFCPIARSAMLFRPLLVSLFVVIFLLTAKDLRLQMLVPVTVSDLLPNGHAALKTASVLSVGCVLVFFTDRLSRPFSRRERSFAWAAVMLCIILMMTVCCLGMFGPKLTSKMSYPFFRLVRDLSVLGSLERAEPVVLAFWVLSDFVMLSLLLQAAGKNLRFCFGCKEPPAAAQRTSLRYGRWLIPLCSVTAAACALALPGDISTFLLLSDTVVPLINTVFVFALPLPVLAIGLLRKKL